MPGGQNGCMTSPRFRADLYRGAARHYEKYRPAYPQALIGDLAERTGADGTRRLLDLACGTGQVSFALREYFAEIWAVDREADMVTLAREKAIAAGDSGRWRFVTAAAEQLRAPQQAFSLITIGNAFHRLRRDTVAARSFGWLRPGGYLALAWGGSPYDSPGSLAPWQRTLTEILHRWHERPAIGGRIPAGYAADRQARPDTEILAAAGFEIAGRHEFAVSRVWTLDEITGFVASTSVLSPMALGDDAGRFEADLRAGLTACEPDGQFRQDTTFAYELARRPGKDSPQWP